MSFKRCLKNLLILTLTVGVICSCCSCAVNNKDNTSPTIQETVSTIKSEVKFDRKGRTKKIELVFSQKTTDKPDYDVCKEYNNFLHETFSDTVLTKAMWVQMLLEKLDIEVIADTKGMYEHVVDKYFYDSSDAMITAIENGLLYRGGLQFDCYAPATKQFVCASFVKAMDFEPYYVLYCNDYLEVVDKVEVATVVHLGYFELDENNCFNPDELLSKETTDYLLTEIDTLSILKGKTVLSFGDSIMYGEGNNGVGIAELLSERYGTETIDYSKGGSTFGIASDREQISNQILRAIKNKDKADIILINGGTNDMRKVQCSEISEDFEYKEHGREFFCNGMEYALGLIKDNFPHTPLLYIRAHDMEFSLERNELHYGKKAIDICEKWKVDTVDIFDDTDFNTHDKDMRNKYTLHSKLCLNGDSVHPNRMGYYKYYIPLTATKAAEVLKE